jgi:hypothetical protein
LPSCYLPGILGFAGLESAELGSPGPELLNKAETHVASLGGSESLEVIRKYQRKNDFNVAGREFYLIFF